MLIFLLHPPALYGVCSVLSHVPWRRCAHNYPSNKPQDCMIQKLDPCNFISCWIQVPWCTARWIWWPSLKEFVLTLSTECTQWIKSGDQDHFNPSSGNLTLAAQWPLLHINALKEFPFLCIQLVSFYRWRPHSENHVVWLFKCTWTELWISFCSAEEWERGSMAIDHDLPLMQWYHKIWGLMAGIKSNINKLIVVVCSTKQKVMWYFLF